RPIRVTVSGVAIEALRNHDPQRFHGRPVGFELRLTDSTVVDTAINQARKILSSMLAPWQRLDAVRTFVYPALNFAMRCGVLRKTDWKRLDDAVRPLVKRTLYLPSNAANGCAHGSTRAGAVALPIAAKLSDVCRVDNAYKLLTTPDPGLREMAFGDLYSRRHCPPRVGSPSARRSRPTFPTTSSQSS
ncbi:hypothetical protein MTO96_045292, partial [Rhipicephalus appendiculatus]